MVSLIVAISKQIEHILPMYRLFHCPCLHFSVFVGKTDTFGSKGIEMEKLESIQVHEEKKG